MSTLDTSANQLKQYSWGWISILALLTAFGPLAIDMYLPALPTIANEFTVSDRLVNLSLPTYFLGLVIGQLFYGPISDAVGRKPPLYFGLCLFAVASLACVFAQSLESLLVARFFQALGGSAGLTIARSAIRDRLDLQQSAQAFSAMTLVMGAAPILAPILGSMILMVSSWHLIFAFLMVMAIMTLIIVHFKFDETLAIDQRQKFQFKSTLVTYKNLFKDHRFSQPTFAGTLLAATLFTYISCASAIFITQLGATPQHFAWLFALNAFGYILASQVNRFLLASYHASRLLLVGALIQLTGAIALGIFSWIGGLNLWTVSISLFLVVSGIGFSAPNATALALSKQGHRAGSASAMFGALQFGFGLVGGIMANSLPFAMTQNLAIVLMLWIGLGSIAVYRLLNNDALTS